MPTLNKQQSVSSKVKGGRVSHIAKRLDSASDESAHARGTDNKKCKIPMQMYDDDYGTFHMGMYKAQKWDPKIKHKHTYLFKDCLS